MLKTDVFAWLTVNWNEKIRLLTRPCKDCSKVKQKESWYECTACKEKHSLCVSESVKITI